MLWFCQGGGGGPHLFPPWTCSWSIAGFKTWVIVQGQQSRLWRKRVARYDSLCSELDCKALWKWSVTKIKTLFFFFFTQKDICEEAWTFQYQYSWESPWWYTRWHLKNKGIIILNKDDCTCIAARFFYYYPCVIALSMIHTDTRRRFYRWPLYKRERCWVMIVFRLLFYSQ